MPTENTFTDFIGRIRAGDEQAAAELVARFEPVIRLEVRMGIRDPRLNRILDSTDVCQSVLASFFVRAASGQFDLANPQRLTQLLVRMAQNKLAAQARRHHRERRDVRRVREEVGRDLDAVDPAPSPSQLIAGKDLLVHFRQRLTDEERRMADWRAQGRTWEDIAAKIGGNAKARCRQLCRAIDRVSRQLGLDECKEEGNVKS
jgi:RNA polymerase sigma-70 factor (ECF subfamily)